MSPATTAALPVIVICAPEHGDVLASEFGRYTRDYELRLTATAEETTAALREISAAGGRVPLLVTESELPDSGIYQAFAACAPSPPRRGGS